MKRHLLSATLTAAVLAVCFCLPIIAEEKKEEERTMPEVDGKPGTEQGGVRGSCSAGKVALGAIASEPSLITTTAAYPVFLFSISKTSATEGEFILANATGELVYRAFVEIPTSPGIIRVGVPPEAASPLTEAGNPYRWEFAVICDESDRSGDEVVGGRLRRLPLSADIQNRLQGANGRDRLSIYREEGLEDDAVIVIDRLRRENPQNDQFQNAWEEWLEKNGLEELGEIPPIGD